MIVVKLNEVEAIVLLDAEGLSTATASKEQTILKQNFDDVVCMKIIGARFLSCSYSPRCFSVRIREFESTTDQLIAVI